MPGPTEPTRRPGPPPPAGHITIVEQQPVTSTGQYPAKATVGRPLTVSARLLKDGHDVLAAALRWQAGDGPWHWEPMPGEADGVVRGSFTPVEMGPHRVQVVAWTDRFAGWRRDLVKRAAAGQQLDVEFEVGARLLDELAGHLGGDVARRVASAVATLRSSVCAPAVRLEAATDEGLAASVQGVVAGWDRSEGPPLALWVDRPRAEFSAWYELFPRSHGGLRGTVGQLERIAAMGFDVLYLPPVHPVGRTHRKGPGNSLVAGPDDPGSPWAIGGEAGGHLALHPDLGDEADFVALLDAARGHGIEVALDYALQCSPDHPWVGEHPEWFTRLPDGSIRFAENPPKKYQDIYPINFWPEREPDRVALWDACLAILRHWIDLGVRIFRVDNPHTKPLALWAWLIEEVHRDHPDVLFLAEAFTAPAMMARLGEVGFSQSYTYFTWRESAASLGEYLEELTSPPSCHQMRPNFWPNTPDILEGVLRNGPMAAFAMRAVLAATLVPSWGIYSGYELGENMPQSPDNTEYLNSEKYQLVRRDYERQPNLSWLLGRLNAFRRDHRSLQRLGGFARHGSDDPAIFAYSRRWDDDVVLMVVNLDPHEAHHATLDLDLDALGFGGDEPIAAHDALTGEIYPWQGAHPWVRLDPAARPAHLLHLRRR